MHELELVVTSLIFCLDKCEDRVNLIESRIISSSVSVFMTFRNLRFLIKVRTKHVNVI